MITLAAGAGSRWTHGAGTVKAIYPFAKLANRFRTFLEVHLAKTRRRGREFGVTPLHVITTSHLTHQPIVSLLEREHSYGLGRGRVSVGGGARSASGWCRRRAICASLGRSCVSRSSKIASKRCATTGRAALIDWAVPTGEASDYRDNIAAQCLHPVGHCTKSRICF